MRIAMIGQKTILSRIGGVEVVVEALATELVAQGNEVYAYDRWLRSETEATAKTEDYQGVHIRRLRVPQIPGINAAIAAFASTWAAHRDRPDVIHFHAEGSGPACLLAHLLGMPCVLTVHGLDWQRSKWGRLARRYLLFAERMLVRHADEIIVLSEGNRRYFRERYGRETTLIPNGISARPRLPAHVIRERWGLERDGYILFLARLTPEKGLEHLIAAYRQLDTDRRLVIAGSGDDEAYAEHIRSLVRGDDRILMTGFVQGEALDELFSNAWCYCLPSEIEGMPMSLLEALSFGCRCVVSDIPENLSIAPEHVLAFRSKDPGSLAEQLEKAAHSVWTEEDRLRQIRSVTERYSRRSIARETKACYERAIDRRRHR